MGLSLLIDGKLLDIVSIRSSTSTDSLYPIQDIRIRGRTDISISMEKSDEVTNIIKKNGLIPLTTI